MTNKGLLAGVALMVLTATGAHAAPPEKNTYQFRGLEASGWGEWWYSETSYLDLLIDLLDQVTMDGAGPPEPVSVAFVSFISEDFGEDYKCVYGQGVIPIAKPDISRNLASASVQLQGSLNGYDCAAGGPRSSLLSVSATWTGVGTSSPSRDQSVDNSIGYHRIFRSKGVSRDAVFVATGSIGDISLQGVPRNGVLTNASYGSIEILH